MVVPLGGVTWLPYRILSISHEKELLWSLWVAVGDVLWHVDPKQKVISTRGGCRSFFAHRATAAQLGKPAAPSSAEGPPEPVMVVVLS